MITAETLRLCVPDATLENVEKYAPHVDTAMAESDITTAVRMADFIAQLAHESGGLLRVAENLNYRPDAIMATFNTNKVRRFTPQQAERYGRTTEHPANQEWIANIAYANRMGNGGPESGDGWRTRGAGLIQLTGTDNHRAVAEYFGIPFDQIGDWLRTPEGAARSAGWFWMVNGLNAYADRGDFLGESQRINGSGSRVPNGWDDRQRRRERVRGVLGLTT